MDILLEVTNPDLPSEILHVILDWKTHTIQSIISAITPGKHESVEWDTIKKDSFYIIHNIKIDPWLSKEEKIKIREFFQQASDAHLHISSESRQVSFKRSGSNHLSHR
ncbi:MAG: hypothetical protein FJ161_04650 [Gammaproteobacteria bacterium]|nr:hypothetical protein [Gammaproteobacteria bacterium]